MIVPPAVTSSAAAQGLNPLNSGLLSSTVNAATGESLFQSLFEATVAGLASNVSSGSTNTDSTLNVAGVGSAPKGGASATRKPSSSEDAQNQQNTTTVPIDVPDQTVSSLLLGLFGSSPTEVLPTNQSPVGTDATVSGAPIANQRSPSQAVATQDLSQLILSPPPAKNQAATGTSQRVVLANELQPMQPVFTVTMRPDAAQQPLGSDQTTASAKVDSSAVPQANTPQATVNNMSAKAVDSDTVAVTSSAVSQPITQNSATQNSAGGNASTTSSDAVAASTAIKSDSSESNSGNKSSDDSGGDRLLLPPLIETATAPATDSSATRFELPQTRPVTEYAPAEQTANTQAASAVTEIRLQVDGTANQHVNVRMVQEADGLRVSVRSNDPALTQSLQERVPELTTRLEQHHYQAEVLLPERSEATHFTPANSGTNMQQDSPNRQHGSPGQGSSQHKQNQQQQQQTWQEEDDFSSLLV